MTENGRLAGKTAIVTGAAQGIGRAVAIAFAREGATVVATDSRTEPMHDLSGKGVAHVMEMDVTSAASIESVRAAHPAVDVIFNCAGIVHQGSILECTDEEWHRAFDINVFGMHRTIRAFLPEMLRRGQGSIINVATAAASLHAMPARHAYNSSKAAVFGLTKGLAADFIGQGIRCNTLCPGTVESPTLGQRIDNEARQRGVSRDEVRREYEQRQRMGRLALPEELAPIAIFLASDESAYATGATFVVDGGFSM